jgi:hypothetical protein
MTRCTSALLLVRVSGASGDVYMHGRHVETTIRLCHHYASVHSSSSVAAGGADAGAACVVVGGCGALGTLDATTGAGADADADGRDGAACANTAVKSSCAKAAGTDPGTDIVGAPVPVLPFATALNNAAHMSFEVGWAPLLDWRELVPAFTSVSNASTVVPDPDPDPDGVDATGLGAALPVVATGMKPICNV